MSDGPCLALVKSEKNDWLIFDFQIKFWDLKKKSVDSAPMRQLGRVRVMGNRHICFARFKYVNNLIIKLLRRGVESLRFVLCNKIQLLLFGLSIAQGCVTFTKTMFFKACRLRVRLLVLAIRLNVLIYKKKGRCDFNLILFHFWY